MADEPSNSIAFGELKKKAKNHDILKIIDLYIEFFESKDSNSIIKMLNNLKEQCLSLSEELEFCEFPIAIDVRDVVFLSFYIGHLCCQIEALLGGNTFFSNRLHCCPVKVRGKSL